MNPAENNPQEPKGFDFNSLVSSVEFMTSIGKRQFTVVGTFNGAKVGMWVQPMEVGVPNNEKIHCDLISVKLQIQGDAEVVQHCFKPETNPIPKSGRVNIYSTAISGYHGGQGRESRNPHLIKGFTDAFMQALDNLHDDFKPAENIDAVKQFWIEKLFTLAPPDYRVVRKLPVFGLGQSTLKDLIKSGMKLAYPEKLIADDEPQSMFDDLGSPLIPKEVATPPTDEEIEAAAEKVLNDCVDAEGIKAMGGDSNAMATANDQATAAHQTEGMGGVHAPSAPHDTEQGEGTDSPS